MALMTEKRLYAPEAVNPGDDIAELLDAANKKTNLSQISYKTAFPDFSRAVTLTKNTIYRVNSPGWFFRAPNGTLNTDGINGIIIQSESNVIDVFSVPFMEGQKDGGLSYATGKSIYYAAPGAKTAAKGKTADVSSEYCVLILPKRFNSDFTQTNRLVYVTYSTDSSYSGGHCCQMVPVLPSNTTNENIHTETAITYVATTNKGSSVKDGIHTDSMTAETPGMYIMHCAGTNVNDALIFVPAKCSRSFTNYVTQVRTSLSACNLNMYTCDTRGTIKSHQITQPGKEADMCGAGQPGIYANLTVYVINTENRTVHFALPTDDGVFSRMTITGHGHGNSFCGCWRDIFPGGSPDISGRTASFRAYTFGALDTIPVNKTTNPGSGVKDANKPKWSTIDFPALFDLNKTSSLQTFSGN